MQMEKKRKFIEIASQEGFTLPQIMELLPKAAPEYENNFYIVKKEFEELTEMEMKAQTLN